MTSTSTIATLPAWEGFAPGRWMESVDVRDFIQRNYTPYEGDASFLAGPTHRTSALWGKLSDLLAAERAAGGVLDVDPSTPASITSHGPGYLDRDLELIVGFQTDAPLKRAIVPNGGWRMVENGLQAYGYEPDPHVKEIFTKYRKTHNAGVFDAYTAEILAARRSHVVTGLPDAYGRGRIIGDYRRLAALRHRQADRRQACGARRDRRPVRHRGRHPLAGRAGRADARAQGARADGGELRR